MRVYIALSLKVYNARNEAKHFNYLGCELSLDGEPDFDKKRNRFQRICDAIRKNLKKPRTDT